MKPCAGNICRFVGVEHITLRMFELNCCQFAQPHLYNDTKRSVSKLAMTAPSVISEVIGYVWRFVHVGMTYSKIHTAQEH